MSKGLIPLAVFLGAWTLLGVFIGKEYEAAFFLLLTVITFCTYAIVRTLESNGGKHGE
jgi:hypothetical protein